MSLVALSTPDSYSLFDIYPRNAKLGRHIDRARKQSETHVARDHG